MRRLRRKSGCVSVARALRSRRRRLPWPRLARSRERRRHVRLRPRRRCGRPVRHLRQPRDRRWRQHSRARRTRPAALRPLRAGARPLPGRVAEAAAVFGGSRLPAPPHARQPARCAGRRPLCGTRSLPPRVGRSCRPVARRDLASRPARARAELRRQPPSHSAVPSRRRRRARDRVRRRARLPSSAAAHGVQAAQHRPRHHLPRCGITPHPRAPRCTRRPRVNGEPNVGRVPSHSKGRRCDPE